MAVTLRGGADGRNAIRFMVPMGVQSWRSRLPKSAVVLNTELANSPRCFDAVCRQFTVRVHGAEPIRFGQGVKCAAAPHFAALPMQ